MTNQAAQTMPLPEPIIYSLSGTLVGYTANQMHQYARDYAAALSQTAGLADVLSGLRFHCDKGAQGTLERLRRYSKEGDNKRNLLGQTMEEAANIIDRLLSAAPAASGGEEDQ